jgi:hypothetical protein
MVVGQRSKGKLKMTKVIYKNKIKNEAMHWEITQREYDKKWVQWMLMDSRKIGLTATWSRFKWVVTGIWNEMPTKLMNSYSSDLKEIQERPDGRKLYIYQRGY